MLNQAEHSFVIFFEIRAPIGFNKIIVINVVNSLEFEFVFFKAQQDCIIFSSKVEIEFVAKIFKFMPVKVFNVIHFLF